MKRKTMKFIQHYSSSGGNLYEVVAENGKRLLLECGVAWRFIQKALDYNLEGIEGCFLTHEHKDHSKAVRDVLKAGIDVYASELTLSVLTSGHRREHYIANETLTRLDSFEVLSFDVHHDAIHPLGFVIREKATGEYMLFATDTSHISHKFSLPFSIIAVECSYERKRLEGYVESQTINETLAKRLLTSHQEQQVALDYINNHCNLSKCREIHLLHLSSDNIDKEAARQLFERETFRKVITL
jgi:phosphoribosyl 1,2-cyclic phosphodiesterase